MSKEIKFNIKLLVDGKEQLVTATTSVKELRANLEAAKPAAEKFRDKLISLNQSVEALKNASSAINGLRDKMAGLATSYNAVQQANVQLKTIMTQRLNATDEDIKKVNEVISAQTELGVVSGTVQKMGAQQIATFLNEKGTLETLIPAMNDLVVQQKGLNATQEDARGVANLMGKAMMGQTSALRRVDITFSEAQENIMKYGTEQQRATMLAQIITQNVGHMNAELAKTDAGQIKKLEMGFASAKVKLGEFVVQWMPFVTFGAQALSFATSVTSLATSIKSAALVILNLNIATKVWNVTCVTARAVSIGFSAVLQVLRAAFIGASIGATTLKVAIKSLLISTGVGIAIWALTEAISYFATSSDKAKDSTQQLTAEEEAAQAARQQEAQQRAEITAAMDINIAKLKEFKGSKEDEKKLVAEMNNTYGDTLGYYSSVSQWYTALVGNSKEYCDQMINEIRIRKLANEVAELDQQEHDIRYDDTGKLRRYSTKRRKRKEQEVKYVPAALGGGNTPVVIEVEVEDPSDLDKANANLADIHHKRQAKAKQMQGLVAKNSKRTYKQYDGYSKTAPTTTPKATTPKKTTPKKTGNTGSGNIGNTTTEPKTYVEKLQAKLSAAQKVMNNALTVDARVEADAEISEIQKQIDEATKGKVSIEADAEPTYIKQGSDADKRQSYSNAQSNISRVKSDMDMGLINQAEAEKRIKAINKKLEELSLKPIEVQFDTHFDKLQEQLTKAQQEFTEAMTVDAKVKANAKVAEIQAQIDKETSGEISIKAVVEPSYITKGSDDDKRQSYSNAQQKASRIQSDYEIGLIGADDALKQLDELNKEIESIDANLKPLTIEVETKGFQKTFAQIKDGWSTVEGLGNGIKSVADALSGNADAWQVITSLINGFISTAEGIQGVIKLINLLTQSTQKDTAASAANATAKSDRSGSDNS